MDEVSVHARPGEDSDRAVETLGRVACIFKSLPCALKEVPVLRIHNRSVSWTQAEEGCIKHGNIVQHRGPLHIVRTGNSSGVTPAASSSALEQERMDSTPSRRFRQNSETLQAPGKRPAMPTIAIAEGFVISCLSVLPS